MSASKIEWTEVTWNPTTGCDRISPGCDNCYAMTMARRLKAMGSPKYQNDGDPRTSGPGFGVTMHSESVLEPILKWPRSPRMAFLDSMSDVFHARVSADFLGRVFATMALTPQHTYQILTKRPNRMRELLTNGRVHAAMRTALVDLSRNGPSLPAWTTSLMLHQVGTCPWPLPNVWLGTSIESDEYCWRANELRAAPAAVRFLSLEPLLGPLPSLNLDGVDWVIVGGESGPNARPMHPDWARSLRDQCLTAAIAYHFKQWGTWAPGHPHGEGEDGPGDRFVNLDGTTGWASYNTDGGCVDSWCGDFGPDSHFVSRVGKKRAGRELDGRTWDEFPKADGGRVSA